MKRKTALKLAVYRRPLPGSKWIFLGSLLMLVWAVWEFNTRSDAMDGMTQAYFKLVRTFEIGWKDALRVILETPRARKDVLNLFWLALIALFAVVSTIAGRKWTAGFFLIPACAAVFLFHTSESALMQAFNPFEVMKVLSCAGVGAGSVMNIASALSRRAAEKKRLERMRKRKKKLTHGTEKTLIPEQTVPRRPRR